jgi:hypothetical protein
MHLSQSFSAGERVGGWVEWKAGFLKNRRKKSGSSKERQTLNSEDQERPLGGDPRSSLVGRKRK